LKAGTAKRYRVSLRQLDPFFRGKPISRIDAATISAYVDQRQAGGATNATIRRDLVTLSRVLAVAKARGMAPSNPMDDYDRDLLREVRPGIKAPSDAAVLGAVAALAAGGEGEMAVFLRCLRATGMRTGELLRATVEECRSGELTIPETKSGRVRTIDVADAPLPVRGSGRLFPGLPSASADIAGRWKWLRRNLPAEQRFRLHDLRHAYAIAEIRRGRDIYDLSHHLGHSSVKVTEIYLGYAAGNRAASRRGVTQEMTQAPKSCNTKTIVKRGVSD
jgi:integrase